MALNKGFKAQLAAFFANFIFGFSFIFSKTALKYATPSVMLAARFIFAFLFLNIILLFGGAHIKFKGKKILPVLVMGLMQPIIYFYCESYGMLLSSATFAAVMIALVPIGAMLFSAIFMKEVPTILQTLSSIISVLGVIFLSIGGNKIGGSSMLGIIFLIGAIVSAVGFNAISRRTSAEFSPFERTYIMFALSAVIFTFAAVFENVKSPQILISPLFKTEFWVAILYLGGLSSVAAFLMINYANTHLPISQTTVFSNIITVVSLFSGIVILKDTELTLLNLLYSAMIIFGVYGVQRFCRK